MNSFQGGQDTIVQRLVHRDEVTEVVCSTPTSAVVRQHIITKPTWECHNILEALCLRGGVFLPPGFTQWIDRERVAGIMCTRLAVPLFLLVHHRYFCGGDANVCRFAFWCCVLL